MRPRGPRDMTIVICLSGWAKLHIFSGTGKKQGRFFIFVKNLTQVRYFDVIVAGGGAAGVMAAGVAASQGKNVLLCERMEKPQRKVRITGKGRCNLTNMRSEADFLAKVRAGADFFAPAFRAFDNRQTVRFFEQIGVPLTTERGERVFPASGRAWDIADAHIRWAQQQGVRIECHSRVLAVQTQAGKVRSVIIEGRGGAREEIACQAVVLCTGGASYPATGSSGDGYQLAYRLGHAIESIRPSLTPLETSEDTRSLRGLSLRNIQAQLLVDSQSAAEEFGELEFTHEGLGGPVILRLSRRAVDALIDGHRVGLEIDLKPALSPEQLEARIARETEALGAQATARTLAGKLLPAALAPICLRKADIDPETPLNRLEHQERQAFIRQLKAFRLPISDYRPFPEAIVTAGGVDTAQIDPQTLQSKLVKGLYFAGELLDIDADTGGYNLQIAYSTGHLAGELKDL